MPMMLAAACLITAITTSALASQKYFTEEEAVTYAQKQLADPFADTSSSKKLTIIRDLDVNGDQLPDFLVLHPIISCGSRGCTPLFFLNTPQGYCLSESHNILLDADQKIASKVKIDKKMKCK